MVTNSKYSWNGRKTDSEFSLQICYLSTLTFIKLKRYFGATLLRRRGSVIQIDAKEEVLDILYNCVTVMLQLHLDSLQGTIL